MYKIHLFLGFLLTRHHFFRSKELNNNYITQKELRKIQFEMAQEGYYVFYSNFL